MADDSNNHLYLGIDVGGTDVKLGLVDSTGQIHACDRTPTPQLGTPERVFEYAIQFARSAQAGLPFDEVSGVGLAVPGVLDTRESILREVVNLPGWIGVPLAAVLAEVTGLGASVVNDANAAAYAEHNLRDLGDRSLALVTLGTGIGCGVVVGGSPFGGDHGCAGELGHIAIRFGEEALDCTCGSRGHLETYAGAGGVMRRLRERASTAKHAIAINLDTATPRDLAAAAEQGDALCQEVICETGTLLGQAIGLIGQVVDPEVVLLGGAMTFGGSGSKTGESFLASVRAAVKASTLVQVGGNIKIDFASLGNDAGLLGAAMVAKQAVNK